MAGLAHQREREEQEAGRARLPKEKSQQQRGKQVKREQDTEMQKEP